jgi:methyl-accepting chemotaxis protein
MFKRMRVGQRIVLGFSLVLILAAVVAVVSYTSINTASERFMDYREMAMDTNLSGRLQANMLMVRMNVKDFILTGSEEDLKQYQTYVDKTQEFTKEAQKEIQKPERAKKIRQTAEALKIYETTFSKVVELVRERQKIVKDSLNVIGPQMEKKLTFVLNSAKKDGDMEAAYQASVSMRNLLLGRIYVVKFFDDNLKASSERANKEFKTLMDDMGELKKTLKNPERLQAVKDVEKMLGEYLKSFARVVDIINERNGLIKNTLDKIGPQIAQLVEDVKLDIKAVQDTLGPALVRSNEIAGYTIAIISLATIIIGIVLSWLINRGITGPLRNIIGSLNESSVQIEGASTQVAQTSQVLAEGASEQAAAVEETSSSLEEMSSMTRQNAENAKEANSLMETAKQIVGKVDNHMGDMFKAMEEIRGSSEETSKIIKTIDEIAFQTNLLALNAAVEAARAGEAGAGFAVVADEVRNLAMRAAEAAKNTAHLIEGTIQAVKNGSELTESTKEAFKENVEISGKVADLVAEISAASSEQAQGIDQVNTAVTDIDKVTQSVAANAEESAAAAEELTAQSSSMDELVKELVVMVMSKQGEEGSRRGLLSRRKTSEPKALPQPGHSHGGAQKASPSEGKRQPGSPKDQSEIPMDDDSFADF